MVMVGCEIFGLEACREPELALLGRIVIIVACRAGCGGCCIALSISSAIPGMSGGKPAGIPCVQLLPDYRCALFGRPERPAVCVSLRPMESMCGATREEALANIASLEQATRPG